MRRQDVIALREMARATASTRIGELKTEIATLYRLFPDLRPARPNGDTPAPKSRKRKRKPMTAAQRRAVGERMRRYWEARRKAEAKK